MSNQKIRIGLNGFGRIGRAITRIALENENLELVCINTRKRHTEMMAYLLQHDSIYRTFGKEVSHDQQNLYTNGNVIAVTESNAPAEIPWDQYNVDVVIDATGAFKTKDKLMSHAKKGVQRIILTAPAKDQTLQVVIGVNDHLINDQMVISNASCTTNCTAPVIQTVKNNFGIESVSFTTVHAYTATQNLLDNRHEDFARSRAASLSLIPTTTGASKSLSKIFPDLNDKIKGMAIRVPVPTGSLVDFTIETKNKVTVDQVHEAFCIDSQKNLKNVLKLESKPLVSCDYIGSPYSSIIDANCTQVLNSKTLKLIAWYDNEWGYSQRVVDLVTKSAKPRIETWNVIKPKILMSELEAY